ncbi:hypothetical protein AAVH_29165 [Aphelenchoides avenae]|nr:hypothetical protein AAVH_29165 [Aphelenchus avenae]
MLTKPLRNDFRHLKFNTETKKFRTGKASHQAQIFKGTASDGTQLAIRKVFLKFEGRKPKETDPWDKPKLEQALVEELRLWRRASSHPLIVPVHAWTVGWASSGKNLCLYAVMPLVNGLTLQDACTHWGGRGPRKGLNSKDIRDQWKMLHSEIILTVAHLHKIAIAHLSLHQRNIMVELVPNQTINEYRIKIIDFGRAMDLSKLAPEAARLHKVN